MKQKHIFTLLLLLITIILIACLTQKKTPIQQTDVTTTELPTSTSGIEIPAGNSDLQIVEHPGFTLAYSEEHEQAAWVAYELTAEEVAGTASRTDRFLEDPAIRTGSATDNDYKGSGYDRGHLAPAADMKWSVEAMRADANCRVDATQSFSCAAQGGVTCGPMDTDANGNLDLIDFAKFASIYRKTCDTTTGQTTTCGSQDADPASGTVDLYDFNKFASNYRKSNCQ